jgi:hypothetical protein
VAEGAWAGSSQRLGGLNPQPEEPAPDQEGTVVSVDEVSLDQGPHCALDVGRRAEPLAANERL